MELVQGDTLAERIARGAIPAKEALAIARQLADALDVAHERSIVHRDLKPSNIKITPEGVVKVLDFGWPKSARPLIPRPPTCRRSRQTSPTPEPSSARPDT
jgi:serine/threonine-protein kinase